MPILAPMRASFHHTDSQGTISATGLPAVALGAGHGAKALLVGLGIGACLCALAYGIFRFLKAAAA